LKVPSGERMGTFILSFQLEKATIRQKLQRINKEVINSIHSLAIFAE
jgi:hypothetical protein